MRNLKLTVEYDGTNYCGWQRQREGISIQGVLEEKLSFITQEKVRIVGSGRTDAGVHAIGQVAHVHLQSLLPTNNILRGMNSLLPLDIAVKKVEEVDERFHARFDAKSKVYLYYICNQPTRSAIFHRYVWTVPFPLQVEAMQGCIPYLEGCHDFTSFSALDTGVTNRVRTIMRLEISVPKPGLIKIEIEADGFLRHMVRTIVGTLVEVGKGRLDPLGVKDILHSKDRAAAGPTAPPQGLFLKEVKYGE
ncbi:MAG: tRNA pseudouridine(38-40) synthase TruA [Syntrophales bacterium]|nr:tRNA pseudouridine(38-40) synthase TruA [Syntrophales bacterium]